jgi:hypothetical protein
LLRQPASERAVASGGSARVRACDPCRCRGAERGRGRHHAPTPNPAPTTTTTTTVSVRVRGRGKRKPEARGPQILTTRSYPLSPPVVCVPRARASQIAEAAPARADPMRLRLLRLLKLKLLPC